MPELPEVECVKQGVSPLMGEVVCSASSNYPKLWDRDSEDIVVLKKQRLKNIERKGKYLRFVFEDYHLLLHLGMSGVLLWNQKSRPHTHVVFSFGKGSILEYSDPRKFGHLNLQKIDVEFQRWRDLGEDALSDSWNGAHLYERISKSKSTIKSLLLNQKIVAGVGNIYASEILFASGLSPLRIGKALSLIDCIEVTKNTKVILKESIDQRGTTFSDYRLTNGKDGSFQSFLKVFQKEGKFCGECKGVIEKLVQNKRSTFYCKNCQK